MKINHRNKAPVMQTHANLSQGGQISVVAQHRTFSQPADVARPNLIPTGDPWCSQSTGRQMAPTAPLRANKRQAPQPMNDTKTTVSTSEFSVSLQTTSVPDLQFHQTQPQAEVHPNSSRLHNVNQIHDSHAASHLLPNVFNSQNKNSVVNNAKNIAMSNQQQQQQMLIFCPQGSLTGGQVSNTAAVATKSGNNIMAASLTSHERARPLKSTTLGGSIQQSGSSQAIIPQQTLPLAGPLCASMSTSLHSFEKSCTSSNPSTVASWSASTDVATGSTPNITSITHKSHHETKANIPQRKCEVQLNTMPWFHGSITRDDAEHLLNPREDGLFLVRESTNFPGDYTLCVCFQGKVEHYRVKYLENQLTIDDEEFFENLWQLVAHYEADADGLCTQLVKCLPKAGVQPFCLNSKDFIDKGWVIPETDLQLRESIGKGEFGDVMLGILHNEKVAVKMLKDEGAVQKFLAEASVMTTLEHENLVKFIGLVFTPKHIYLVTEYMSKGSLVDYLRSRGRQHITKRDQINFAYDTASGMEYLEQKKVVHRDLAARNVLISEECVAKVSDFGLARGECYNLDAGKLPIKWTAPEALKNGRFSNKSDMWSFGILLWEIYSFGRVPYPRIPLNDVVKHVEVGYKMEAPEGCPAEIYEMMRLAWDLNPSKRPTFSELKMKLLYMKKNTS